MIIVLDRAGFGAHTLEWAGTGCLHLGTGAGRHGQMNRPKISSRACCIAAAGIAVASLGVVLGIVFFGSAEVTGRTSQERIASLCRLVDERPRGAADAIAAVATEDSDPSVRRAAIVALGKFLDPAHRGIIEVGTADGDAGIRSAAAATLGLYPDENTVPVLEGLLRSDPDERVRLGAVLGLRRAGGDESIALLAEAMEANEFRAVRRQAMQTLVCRFGLRLETQGGSVGDAQWARAVRTVRAIPAIRAARKRALAANRVE